MRASRKSGVAASFPGLLKSLCEQARSTSHPTEQDGRSRYPPTARAGKIVVRVDRICVPFPDVAKFEISPGA